MLHGHGRTAFSGELSQKKAFVDTITRLRMDTFNSPGSRQLSGSSILRGMYLPSFAAARLSARLGVVCICIEVIYSSKSSRRF